MWSGITSDIGVGSLCNYRVSANAPLITLSRNNGDSGCISYISAKKVLVHGTT
jgi:hypothetical protein